MKHLDCVKLLLLCGVSLKHCQLNALFLILDWVPTPLEVRRGFLTGVARLFLASGYIIVNSMEKVMLETSFILLFSPLNDSEDVKKYRKEHSFYMFTETSLNYGIEYINIVDNDWKGLSDFLDNAPLRMKQGPSLQHLCRQNIRLHLIKLRQNTNLFFLIPHLHLPKSITNYLLYSVDPYQLQLIFQCQLKHFQRNSMQHMHF